MMKQTEKGSDPKAFIFDGCLVVKGVRGLEYRSMPYGDHVCPGVISVRNISRKAEMSWVRTLHGQTGLSAKISD
jgi:hypothetical protein